MYVRNNGFGPSVEGYRRSGGENTNICYMIEVQKYFGEGYIHVGYMNAKFNYIEEAVSYYNSYNPSMHPIIITNNTTNIHNNNIIHRLCSNIHHDTHLRYIIREYNNEILTIDPFDVDDLPKVKKISHNTKMISYPTLFPKSIYKSLEDNSYINII